MPLTPDQEANLRSAFRPHAPIEDPNSFIGREEPLRRIREALSEPGLHAIVYGERGCGKTSLANVATAEMDRIQVFCEKGATFPSLLRDAALKFQAAHPAEVTFDAIRDCIITKGITVPASALTGNMFLQVITRPSPMCIVYDELDRIQTRAVIEDLAELTKNAATFYPTLTFVMVGVSETADGLLSGHSSNFRNLRQVHLTRMMRNELFGILHRGEKVLGIKFEQTVADEMASLSDRMPYYLHLLATSSARAALARGSLKVENQDLIAGTSNAAQDVDQSLRETYERAIMSGKKSQIYRRVIWAMASLDETSCNFGSITTRVNQIARQETDSDVTGPAVGAALKRLMSAEKDVVVTQVMTGVYRFTHPLMRGFVRVARFSQ